MVATKNDVRYLIDTMSDKDFLRLCDFLNATFIQDDKRKAAEERFVSEVKAAEESVARGNYVTLSQLHDYLGV